MGAEVGMVRWRWAACVAIGAAALVMLAWATSAGAAGKAELSLQTGSSQQPVGTPFDVTVSIARTDLTWGVYNVEVAYDTTVLKVNGVTMLPIASCDDSNWASPPPDPTLVIACVFQESTATGPVDTISMQCLKNGSSVLHLVTLSEDSSAGSSLYDPNANPIPTDLTDGPTITCGSGGPVQTVAIPTNPSQSDIQTVAAGGVPSPNASEKTAIANTATTVASTPGAVDTIAAVNTAVAQGTHVPTASGTEPSGAATGPGGTNGTAGPSGVSQPSGSSEQRTAQAASQPESRTTSGGSSHTGLIIGIVIAVVVVVAAGGGAWYWRQRGQSGL